MVKNKVATAKVSKDAEKKRPIATEAYPVSITISMKKKNAPASGFKPG